MITVRELEPEQGVKAALRAESLPEYLALTQFVSEVTTNPRPAMNSEVPIAPATQVSLLNSNVIGL